NPANVLVFQGFFGIIKILSKKNAAIDVEHNFFSFIKLPLSFWLTEIQNNFHLLTIKKAHSRSCTQKTHNSDCRQTKVNCTHRVRTLKEYAFLSK
ncbi:MAG: hypothetical protein ACLU8R_00005, partial [Acutalibacteraceae bacterium]